MSEDHPEKVSPKDSEDVAPEDSEWVSVGDLLRRSPSRDPVPVAHLATALEKFSCYEIDRFGRQVSKKENEAVLNMVARWNELENYTPSGHHPDTDPGWILEELDRFGWPRANVPDFDSMKPGAEEPLGETERHSMQRAIVGLVALVSERRKDFQKPSGPNVNKIVLEIGLSFARQNRELPRGYGISTLSDVISEAIEACKEEVHLRW